MINKSSKIIQCLIDLGFSERESKIYAALLNKHNATATDLQRISGVPQNKIYEILNCLVRRGLCSERREGKKRTFEIIDPQITLSSSFERLENKVKEALEVKDDIYDLFSNTDEITNPLEYIELLNGNDNIHHQYCQLVNSTNEELLGFGRGPYACDTNEKTEEQDVEEEGILKRGGILRWVYEINLPEDELIVNSIIELQKKGGFYRIAETLPLKMMIFDCHTLLLAEETLLSKKGELSMSIIKQNTIVNAFRALFNFFWDHSEDLETWVKKNIK